MMHIHHQWQWQFSHQNGLFLPKKSNHFFHDLVGTVSNDLAVIKGAAMPLTLTEKNHHFTIPLLPKLGWSRTHTRRLPVS